MDCRKQMFWSLALISGLAGCTTTGTNSATNTPSPSQNFPPSQNVQVSRADIQKESSLPRIQPSPRICVEGGRFAASEAESLTNSPVAANEMRDNARKAFQQALRNDPSYLPASQGLAKLYLQMEDYEHAVSTLAAAAKLHPNEASVWFDLGMVYSSRKDWTPALDYLGRAAQLDPENRLYVDMLGHCQARAGKLSDAVQTYKRVGTEAKAYYNVARMLEHLNQPEMSRQYLAAAVQKDPQLTDAQEMLARLSGSTPATVQQVGYTPAPANNAPTTSPR